ncbi:hypothetical protein PLICRDRAFT_41901 [Plicaturopsis crispa FD-325 SS-3]|nr:hypothetical protein PLICRDRAFT_41901 [Plicaturopsis crispa FD-325 SS-3]
MANPRQRRKARSSSHKAVSHSRHAKKNLKKMPTIRGPKILQDAWDKHKTVRQNYAALGLVSNLNPCASGGVEREIIDLGDHDSGADDTAAAGPSRLPGQPIPKGHGRIVRDEAGNVVGVELAEEDEDTQNVADADDDEMRDPEIDPHVRSNWVEDLGASAIEGCRSGVKEDVVKALEHLSSTAAPQKRFTSGGEVSYLSRLVSKHGDDVEAMARNRRLNPEQKTAGELRRAIRKAGGIDKLR